MLGVGTWKKAEVINTYEDASPSIGTGVNIYSVIPNMEAIVCLCDMGLGAKVLYVQTMSIVACGAQWAS